MLTDIFADRYSTIKVWDEFNEPERRLLVQAFRILVEQVCPYYVDGKESAHGKTFWTDINSRLSMELGLKSLSPTVYSYQNMFNGKAHTTSGTWPMHTVCENWIELPYDGSVSADRFIKERLSLVEIGFRVREEEIAVANAGLPERMADANFRHPLSGTFRMPGNPGDGIKALSETNNAQFQDLVSELNTRFRRAGCDLNYHNGFIQRSADTLSLQEIETPFWSLVADPKWKNVDMDMKEALDLRDAGARDSAFHAARALESTIKIVSDEKGWTNGKESGAVNFIEKLASKKRGFLDDWEADALKEFFAKIRNRLGHGPGNEEMPSLTKQQTDWAIETCMVWIKSIIRRL